MDMDPEIYFKAFIELNQSDLGKDSSLVAGRIYYLPEEIKQENPVPDEADAREIMLYPVFGPDNEYVEVKSRKLNGAIYYLVSGHGGPDPGALGTYNGQTVSEDEYAYDVTLRLAKNLLENGADVRLIVQDDNDGIRDEKVLKMDNDEEVYTDKDIPRNQRSRLKQRSDLINKMYAENKGKYQRLITIHVDSRSQGQNIDVFFYHHHKSTNGKKLAESIHKTFKEKYSRHQPGRNYHGTVTTRSTLYMIRNTHLPMVYIELGNIRNARDQQRLVLSNNRQALANWIGEGVMLDYTTTQARLGGQK
jgi:N-acetylmuramoyl-L-alanine amidase